MKIKKQYKQAAELLEIFSRQWATINDIKDIGSVGNNKAYSIRKEIREKFKNKGCELPNGLVPMEAVIDYFKININYLKKVKKESESK